MKAGMQSMAKSGFPVYCLSPSRHYRSSDKWVTVGVLVSKTITNSQNGRPYSRWRLADLKGEDLTVMLFGAAHTRHYSEVSLVLFRADMIC
jgi:hypothetical protein